MKLGQTLKIKRIFFDSGKVLIYPKSGHWFYPEPYFEFCKENKLPVSTFRQNRNYKNAYQKLSLRKLVPDLKAELDAFTEFYSNLFSGIKGKDTESLVALCADYTVNSMDKYIFYDDVKSIIHKLSREFNIGIITDAWPSVLNIYENETLDKYFTPFIISTIYGEDKTNLELFKIALEVVEEKPEEILFVDDSPGNLNRASNLGMKVFQLNRERKFSKAYKSSQNLTELYEALAANI